jgi:hypothetical protein
MRWGFSVSKGSRRTDICDVCHVYDTQLEIRLKEFIDEVKQKLKGHVESYFDDFDASVGNTEEFHISNFRPYCNPLYYTMLMDYIKDHEGQHLYYRSCLPQDARAELETDEKIFSVT